MAPRLNKRQQRELEELEALGSNSRGEISSDEENIPLNKKPVFSNILSAEEIESETENDGSVKPTKSRKKKKNKKGDVSAVAEPLPAKAIPTRPAAKNQKKAAKKAKAKERKAGDEELERALAELSTKYPETGKFTDTASDSRSLASLLSVSVASLDREAEMRKYFGARVVQANRTSGSSTRRNAMLQRSNLTKPQSSWWSASQREGLSVRVLTDREFQSKQDNHGWISADEKWWTVDYSQRYKSMTKLFIQAVMSGNPNALWDIQRKLPWHADNLLQLAEVYRHQEEHAQAVDFVDRAIYTYERAFIGAFNFTSGINRLDFDRVENRPFFLAIHRQISDLQRRGFVRTAFEFARLLYSLDPWEDPHGALYHLETLALKGGMSKWIVDVYDHFTRQRELREKKHEVADRRIDPSVLPGFVYSRALALKILEDAENDLEHKASTTALKEALLSFPSIVPLLADKAEVPLSTSIRAHRDFRIETDAGSLSDSVAVLHALSHMYVLRCSSIWKEPLHSSWFLSTTTSVFSSIPASLPITPQRQAFLTLMQNENLRYSIYRHIVVLETTHRRLFAFMPSRVLEAAKSLACDPLPPKTALTIYDDTYFYGTEDIWSSMQPRTRQQRALDERLLEQAIPNAEIRQRIMHVLEGLAGQFPGGLQEMIEQVGPEAVEDILGQAQAMALGGDDVMPGGLPGLEEVADVPLADAPAPPVAPDTEADDDESSSDSEAETSTVRRVLRGIVSRFWGEAARNDETSSDEDFDRPVDNTGVD